MAEKNVQITAMINPQTRAKLERMAATEGVSRSELIRRILTDVQVGTRDADYDSPSVAMDKLLRGEIPNIESALDLQRLTTAAEKMQSVRAEEGQLLPRAKVRVILDDLAVLAMESFGAEWMKAVENTHQLPPGVLRESADIERNRLIDIYNKGYIELLGDEE